MKVSTGKVNIIEKCSSICSQIVNKKCYTHIVSKLHEENNLKLMHRLTFFNLHDHICKINVSKLLFCKHKCTTSTLWNVILKNTCYFYDVFFAH